MWKLTPEEEVMQTGPFYNQRYCEVLVTEFDPGTTSISLKAYNTVGCNTCPEEEWSTLDAETLAEELSSPFVRLNGPRYWVLDSISSPTISNSCDASFGGLEMSLVASIPITVDDITTEIAYEVNAVERNTVWYYYKGSRVYMLEDPSGKCFIMQSYSQKVDTNLKLEDLETLGNRLNLPPGWAYKSVILEEDFDLETQNGLAELVSDELENAYQYLQGGCL
jgi:haloalkane dehalogenase